MPVIALVGHSGSGKTLLAEQVTSAGVDKGLRVAYVKHAPHGFEPGRPDSNSERVREAGADPVVVIGPNGRIELTGGGGDPLPQLLTGLRGDVVLLEGFSSGPWPKVRVTAAGNEPREVADPVVLELVRHGQRFTDDDVTAVLDLVQERQAALGPDVVRFQADGRAVPLRGFAHTIVASTVRGLTASLRGVEDADHLAIEVRREHPSGG